MDKRILGVYLFAALLAAEGCTVPVSRTAAISVSGELRSASGQPLPGKKVEITLPSDYGLNETDLTYGAASSYGHQNQQAVIMTDVLGSFAHAFHPVSYSTAFWVLPPLGSFPRKPPAPFFYVRLLDDPEQIYGIIVKPEETLYRVYKQLPGAAAPVPGDKKLEVNGKLREEERGAKAWVVELKLQELQP